MTPAARPRKRLSLARVALVGVAGGILLLGAAVYWCTAMPGASLRGELPRLTEAEASTAQELRRHQSPAYVLFRVAWWSEVFSSDLGERSRLSVP